MIFLFEIVQLETADGSRPPSIFKVNLFMILCFLWKNFMLFSLFSPEIYAVFMLVQMEFGETCNDRKSLLIPARVWGRCKSSSGSRAEPWWESRGEVPRGPWGLAALQQQKQLEIPL